MYQSATHKQGGIGNDNAQILQPSIRLSIITQFYPPDYAATGQLIEELAIQLRNTGAQVHVFKKNQLQPSNEKTNC